MAEARILERPSKFSCLTTAPRRVRRGTSGDTYRHQKTGHVSLESLSVLTRATDKVNAGAAHCPNHDTSEEWPIWKALQEILKDVPEEAFDELPRDGAAQHDHYIYGTPKRPQ